MGPSQVLVTGGMTATIAENASLRPKAFVCCRRAHDWCGCMAGNVDEGISRHMYFAPNTVDCFKCRSSPVSKLLSFLWCPVLQWISKDAITPQHNISGIGRLWQLYSRNCIVYLEQNRWEADLDALMKSLERDVVSLDSAEVSENVACGAETQNGIFDQVKIKCDVIIENLSVIIIHRAIQACLAPRMPW